MTALRGATTARLGETNMQANLCYPTLILRQIFAVPYGRLYLSTGTFYWAAGAVLPLTEWRLYYYLSRGP